MIGSIKNSESKVFFKKQKEGKIPFKFDHFYGWKLGLPSEIKVPKPEHLPTIVAIGGGKGGVGKSVISANLSTVISSLGYRVLVVDLDLGCSNLHTHFGAGIPKVTLADYVLHNRMSYRDIILPAPVNGVAFIAGGRDEDWSEYLDHSVVKLKLWDAIINCRKEFNVDLVVLDLGAGVHRHTMDFFSLAHLGAVTVVPEPTSIENAYMFLKLGLWKLIENLGEQLGAQLEVAEIIKALSSTEGGSIDKGYINKLATLKNQYPEIIQYIYDLIQGHLVGVLVNQTRMVSDMEIGQSMEHICRKYFGLNAFFLGFLNFDESVWKSLRSQRLLVKDFPHSLIAKRLSNIATQVVNLLALKGH